MTPSKARNSNSRLLARIVDAAASQDPLWSSDDLAVVLHHQLRAPLLPDLVPNHAAPHDEILGLCETASPPIRTFEDLFHHPRPPLRLLRFCHEFAKRHGTSPDGLLPKDIASVLYFTAILLARSHGHAISRQDDSTLREGAAWIESRPWVEPRLKALVHELRDAG